MADPLSPIKPITRIKIFKDVDADVVENEVNDFIAGTLDASEDHVYTSQTNAYYGDGKHVVVLTYSYMVQVVPSEL